MVVDIVSGYSPERKEVIKQIVRIVKEQRPVSKKEVYKQLTCSPSMKGYAWKDACAMGGIYQIDATHYDVWNQADWILNEYK